MTSYGYLFEVAIQLAVLSFYIGVLIYALPLPIRGVKRWGGQLLRDSMFSFALAISLTAVMEFAQGVAGMLGGSWAYFDAWFQNGVQLILGLKVAAMALSSLTSYVPGASAARALLGPLNDALTADLLFMATLGALEAIVRYGGTLLALIGLVLFALPFRLGREAGAWFIAFVVTFSVGLQVMPAFISYIASSPPVAANSAGASLGLTYEPVTVHASDGQPIGNSELVLYSYVDGEMKEVAQYWVTSSGAAYDPSSPEPNDVSMPSTAPVYSYVYVDGVGSQLDPYPFYPGNYSMSQGVSLYSPYILYSSQYDTIVLSNQPGNVSLSQSGDALVIRGNLSFGGIVEVRSPNTCSLNVSANIRPASGSWSWYGVKGTYWYVQGPVNFTMVVVQRNCTEPRFSGFTAEDYAQTYFGVNFVSVNLIEDFLLYYFTVPIMYIATLTTIAYALARLLGGRRGIMPRVT